MYHITRQYSIDKITVVSNANALPDDKGAIVSNNQVLNTKQIARYLYCDIIDVEHPLHAHCTFVVHKEAKLQLRT